MEANLKKVLLSMVYYSMIAIMLAFVVFYMITLANATMSMWEQVVFYITVGLLAAVTIYDIVCTCMNSQKYISGFILYVVTLILIIFSLIVLALNSANGRLLIDLSEKFFRIILFSYLINALAIAIYCTGEKLVVTTTNRAKK